MARPQKEGLDYFSLDVDMDTKVKLVQARFGLIGFGLFVKLLQHIYRNGYYTPRSEDDRLIFILDVGMMEEEIVNMVSFFLDKGLLNKELFEKYGILTSTGIQKRYVEGTRKRKDVQVIEQYWLLGDFDHISVELSAELTELKEEETQLTAEGSSSKAELTELKEEESTQSKVKESKVKENNIDGISFDTFWNTYDKKVGDKEKTKKKREKLSASERGKIMETLPTFLSKIKEKQYQPYPLTYLNQRRREDETVVEELSDELLLKRQQERGSQYIIDTYGKETYHRWKKLAINKSFRSLTGN